MQILKRHGVAPSRCAKLVATFGADLICDTVEYLESQMKSGKRNAIENPAEFIIYSLENELPVPAEFLTTRRREQMKQALERERAEQEAARALHLSYMRWADAQHEQLVKDRYAGDALDKDLGGYS